jgi:hypothetical protein
MRTVQSESLGERFNVVHAVQRTLNKKQKQKERKPVIFCPGKKFIVKAPCEFGGFISIYLKFNLLNYPIKGTGT